MNQSSNTAIILGGGIIGLTTIRAFVKRNIETILVYYDTKDFATASKYLKKTFLAPHPEKEETGFINYLMNLSDEYKGSIIFPTEDEYLIPVSKFKEKLSQHFIVACNNFDVITKLVNKSLTYDIADKSSIPAPRNLVTNDDKVAIEFASQIGFPCLIKPSQGHIYFKLFGKKMAKVFDNVSLEKELLNAVSQNLVVMIQEFIPGNDKDNYSYWGYRDNGKFYSEATAQKVRNDPPGTGSPRVQVTRNIYELIPLARKILDALDYQGYANVEFKKDHRTNEYKFMEINARINRCMLQAIAGGIDYPWIIYNHLKNGILPEPVKCEEGIYWIDVGKDILRSFQFRKIEKYSLKEYLNPYFNNHVFAVLSISDIGPFVKRLISILRK